MKHRSPTNDDGSLERSFDWPPDYFDSSEELIEAARQYFATDFPNPERRGCPAPGAYQSLVNAKQPLSEELRAHLFGCSECLNECRAAALEHRYQTASGRFDRTGGWLTWMTGARRASRLPLAVGAIALLFFVAGLLIWRARPMMEPQLSQDRPQPVPTAPGGAERAKPDAAGTDSAAQSAPAASQSAPELQTKQTELLAFNIDLNEFRSLGDQNRSSAGKEKKGEAIKLPAAQLRLTLGLRENSAAGNYRISIIDSSDRVFPIARARSRDGLKLSVTLDLRRFANQQATLRIERADQPDIAPEDYRLLVVRP